MSLKNLQHILDESKEYIKEGIYLKLSNKIKELYETKKHIKIKYKYIIIANKLAGPQLIFRNGVSRILEGEKIMTQEDYKKLVRLNECKCCATMEHISDWFFPVNENTVIYNYDICQSGLCFNDENDEEVPSIEYNPLKYILLNWEKCDDDSEEKDEDEEEEEEEE
jgi:hypothetical protein